jgi:CarD family transcriptional regulator
MTAEKVSFASGDLVVYPTHGVGKITAIEMQEIAGYSLSVIVVLRGRSRAKRTMWSRRAQEYQAKIASGDPASIAEVVRDLFRNAGQPEQSYSERQIYQAALDRLVREFAAVERIDETTAVQRVEQLLSAA